MCEHHNKQPVIRCRKSLQSPITNQQSPISNQQSTINNHQSTITNQQSTINNQQSTITNQQSKILMVTLAFLVFSLFFVGCKSNEPEIKKKVSVGISKSFLSIPIYVAQKRGLFLKEGLEVTVKEYASGKLATRALFLGDVDISTAADMPVVFNSFKRRDFCIFATFSYSYPFVKIIARKGGGIKTGADLKGRKVGVNRGTSGHFFLAAFLIHNGLSLSDVDMIHMKTVDLPAALKNHRVDAISVWQPYTQEAMALSGDQAVEMESTEIYRTTFNLASMSRFAGENADILERFLRALDHADRFIEKDRDAAREIIAESFNLDKNMVNVAWDDFVFGISLDQSLLVSWDEIARWAIANKLVDGEKIPDYLDYICPKALEAVKPESITIIGVRQSQ